MYEVAGVYYLCSENKGPDQQICAFVFAFGKSRFSQDMPPVLEKRSYAFFIEHFREMSKFFKGSDSESDSGSELEDQVQPQRPVAPTK